MFSKIIKNRVYTDYETVPINVYFSSYKPCNSFFSFVQTSEILFRKLLCTVQSTEILFRKLLCSVQTSEILFRKQLCSVQTSEIIFRKQLCSVQTSEIILRKQLCSVQTSEIILRKQLCSVQTCKIQLKQTLMHNVCAKTDMCFHWHKLEIRNLKWLSITGIFTFDPVFRGWLKGLLYLCGTSKWSLIVV